MHSRPLVVAVALVAVVVAPGAGSVPPKPNQANNVSAAPPMPGLGTVLKPDLIVEKVLVTGTHPDPRGGTWVAVRYTIANSTGIDSWTHPTGAGELFWFDHHDQPSMFHKFYSSLDMRELPGGVFPPPQQGQGCLASLAANARFDCTGEVLVPAGKKVEIRATVDSLNYIDEANEANNTSTPFAWQAAVINPKK